LCCFLSVLSHARTSFTGLPLPHIKEAVGKSKIGKPTIAVHGVRQNFTSNVTEHGAKCQTKGIV
jgi:hypothetical protein